MEQARTDKAPVRKVKRKLLLTRARWRCIGRRGYCTQAKASLLFFNLLGVRIVRRRAVFLFGLRLLFVVVRLQEVNPPDVVQGPDVPEAARRVLLKPPAHFGAEVEAAPHGAVLPGKVCTMEGYVAVEQSLCSRAGETVPNATTFLSV